ncbi:serine/threonine protein kinase [Bellilinea caldifistulae]|uniref:protein kinase domain-containing protein n=1 Tax=Bellilinea caldifistulae TaxID=360411 RepID=UPI000780ACB7|nr:protein kinase [Bellilinea caldifistulae]GAP10694.1 serine/threonine protein kinase [Bellilinea caldifistulae]
MEDSKTVVPILGNRYQLLQTIGTGGMAVVYLGRDTMLERPVAIKILREDYSKNEAFRERFRLEAKAAANLSHPNIVTVHDFGFDSDRLFLVMEYLPGTDLKTILRERTRLPIEEAVNIIVQAAAGIGYAHRAGLIHCDVKPHNILVTPDQRIKVTDFGIARAMASIHPEEKSDVVWGSPLYFSPEQAAGEPPSPASDVYSLGVVLYEMVTGRLPFQSSDPVELARMHREVLPPPPRRFNPEIPPTLEQIILKVLSKEPAARYRTADQFARVLSTFLQNNPEAPVPTHQNPSEADTQPQLIPVQPASSSSLPQTSQVSDDATLNIDWLTIFLALLAILAVGGLIPFWLYIWFSFNPPI